MCLSREQWSGPDVMKFRHLSTMVANLGYFQMVDFVFGKILDDFGNFYMPRVNFNRFIWPKSKHLI